MHIFPLAPEDFGFIRENIFFNPSNIGLMLCIDIPIENDDLCEGDEIFQVALSDNNDPNTLIVAPTLATVTIIDDDGRYFDMHSHKLALSI